MRTLGHLLGFSTALLLLGADSDAAPIRGKKLTLLNPSGDESDRRVLILGKETSTDITAIASDPVSEGATLEVTVNGGSASQTFALDASGWSALPTGYRYRGPTGADGDPVKSVILKRTPAGRALLKVVLDGALGTQDLDLVPPAPGEEITAVLRLGAAENHCLSFGGAAGGTALANTSSRWAMKDATAEPPCPATCCEIATECGWDTGDGSFCASVSGTLGAAGSVCNSASGTCTPAPPAPGPCCDILFSGSDRFCVAGPEIDFGRCTDVGLFTWNGLCDAELGCIPQ